MKSAKHQKLLIGGDKLSVSEQNTFGELWSAKAKEKMRNYLYLDEIRDFVKEWLQQKQIPANSFAEIYDKAESLPLDDFNILLRKHYVRINELLEDLDK